MPPSIFPSRASISSNSNRSAIEAIQVCRDTDKSGFLADAWCKQQTTGGLITFSSAHLEFFRGGRAKFVPGSAGARMRFFQDAIMMTQQKLLTETLNETKIASAQNGRRILRIRPPSHGRAAVAEGVPAVRLPRGDRQRSDVAGSSAQGQGQIWCRQGRSLRRWELPPSS